jgi:hypothetical protein
MKHSKKIRTNGIKALCREIVKNMSLPEPRKEEEKKSFKERVKQSDGKGMGK